MSILKWEGGAPSTLPIVSYKVVVAVGALFAAPVKAIKQGDFEALLTRASGTYRAPSWLRERANSVGFRWRVVALDETGQQLAESHWRNLRFGEAAAAAEKPSP